jgi:hypothetical protein
MGRLGRRERREAAERAEEADTSAWLNHVMASTGWRSPTIVGPEPHADVHATTTFAAARIA